MDFKKILGISFIAAGALVMIYLNYTLIYDLIIPDPCYYHTHEMNFIMKIFYTTDSAANGHPEPNMVNVLLSGVAGAWGSQKILFYLKSRHSSNVRKI